MSTGKQEMPSLIDKLRLWASTKGDETVYTFVDEKGQPTESLSYQELKDQAEVLAALLIGNKAEGLQLQPGDRVMLVYTPSLHFVVAFYACLISGVIAVPVFPPDPRRLGKDNNMFVSIYNSSGAKIALTNSAYNHMKHITALKEKFTVSGKVSWPDLQWVVTDELLARRRKSSTRWPSLASPPLEDVAFLQYTSGSTSDPKGVMITHKNLAHNLSIIIKALEADETTVVVSWLPQFHDMGLIGSCLGSCYCGGRAIFMSPLTFIRNPPLWMQLSSRYHATHLQGPNFAFALTARKFNALPIASRGELNLSSIRHIINGAEPVTFQSIDLFQSTFREYGLRENIVFPTYGLAEHTVFVCDKGSQRLAVDKLLLETEGEVMPAEGSAAKELLGCGRPKDHGVFCKIVDPEARIELEEGRVGEIWLNSESKAKGYWSNPELTARDFKATLNGSENKEGYLRTGDLGFLHGGELFICGRIKDLIIIRGRNHYPQDIEKTIESFEDVRPGCSAAVSSTEQGGSEELKLICEVKDGTKPQFDTLGSRIRALVAKEHGISPVLVVFLKPHTIPKTSSGKISRRRCLAALQSNKLDVVWRCQFTQEMAAGNLNDEQGSPTRGPSEEGERDPKAVLQTLKTEVAALLGCEAEEVDSRTPLIAIGLDSMAIAQVRGILLHRYGVIVEDSLLFEERTTIRTLQRLICGEEGVRRDEMGSSEDGDEHYVETPNTLSNECPCFVCCVIM